METEAVKRKVGRPKKVKPEETVKRKVGRPKKVIPEPVKTEASVTKPEPVKTWKERNDELWRKVKVSSNAAMNSLARTQHDILQEFAKIRDEPIEEKQWYVMHNQIMTLQLSHNKANSFYLNFRGLFINLFKIDYDLISKLLKFKPRNEWKEGDKEEWEKLKEQADELTVDAYKHIQKPYLVTEWNEEARKETVTIRKIPDIDREIEKEKIYRKMLREQTVNVMYRHLEITFANARTEAQEREAKIQLDGSMPIN